MLPHDGGVTRKIQQHPVPSSRSGDTLRVLRFIIGPDVPTVYLLLKL